MNARLALVMILALLAAGGDARAQPPAPDDGAEMPTDRPGYNAPAAVVGPGVVQLELGWATVRGRDRSYTTTVPQPLLRIGVWRYLEFQAASAGLTEICTIGCQWRGSDVSLGSRVVLPAEPLGFALAATGSVSLPTGSFEVSSEHVDPFLVLHVDRPFAEVLEFSYNYQVTRIRDDDPDRAVVRQGHGLSLGATAGRWTPYVGVAWRPAHVEGRVPSLAQAGTGVRVSRDAQLDVTVSMGMNSAESRWGVSAGVALRHRPR